MADARCVLVYNPISGRGHLDSWLAMFVTLLLERGWRVLVLTPDVPALLSRLRQKDQSGTRSLQLLDWDAPEDFLIRARSLLPHVWCRWNTFGDPYYKRWYNKEVMSAHSWKERLFQATVPFLFRATHFLYWRWLLLKKFRQRVLTGDAGILAEDPEGHLADPAEMARRTLRALKKARWKPAIAFNMYMDMYRTGDAAWRSFEAINKLSWAGIRFVPPSIPQEAWYTLSLWRGMCFLDEDVCLAYASALPPKLFEYLPDVTDATLPGSPSPLVQEIRRRASGRRVVFLGGSIGGQKNLACWFKLIALADPQHWFFVQVGEIHRGTLKDDDVAALDRALARPPENLMLHAGYLKDDQTFNAVIAASDVVFAVYRDFNISSNMLGKAAHFRKPVLVSDRYLMGRRVRQYGIGYAVPEDDACAAWDALTTTILNQVPEENFRRYCSDFNEEKFAQRIDQFLRLCLASSGR